MGQLDDAIRDHLELLRRRGADPTEIARAEAEALSPAVREVAEPEIVDESDDVIAGVEPIPAPEPIDDHDAHDDHDFDEAEPDATEPDGAGDEDAYEEELPDEEVLAHGADRDEEEAADPQSTQLFDAFADDEVAEDVAEQEVDEDDAVLHAHDAAIGDATSAEADDERDVLEGTPDFLEESPDHDKLWFEQSGPRDFDFDGDR